MVGVRSVGFVRGEEWYQGEWDAETSDKGHDRAGQEEGGHPARRGADE